MERRRFRMARGAFWLGLLGFFWPVFQAAPLKAQQVCIEEINEKCMRWGERRQPRMAPTGYNQGVSQGDAAEVFSAIMRNFKPLLGRFVQEGAKVTLSIEVSSDGRILGRPKLVAPQGPLDAVHRQLRRLGIAALIETDEQSGLLPVAGREVSVTFSDDYVGLNDAR